MENINSPHSGYFPINDAKIQANSLSSNVVADVSFFFLLLFFFFVFLSFTATPAAYGGSQARGRIEAVAIGLCHRQRNVGSKLHL